MAIDDNKLERLLNRLDILLDAGILDKLVKLQECKYTLFEWLDEWYNTYKVPVLRDTGLLQLRVCINKHIHENFANKKLNEYTALEMQNCLNKIQSTRMRKYTFDTLRASFTKAYNLDLIADNVMLKVDNIKHKRKTGRALTKAEQNAFIKALDNHKDKNLFLFYIGTGCRKSEVLTIRWTDVDYDARRIHVHGSKTDNADRYVPLFPAVAKILKEIPKTSEFVFPTTENAIKCTFRRLKDKHKFTFRIHDLRHTFATRCLEAGVAINTVRLWLGHSKASTTADIYTHVQTDFEKQEAKKLDFDF